MLLEFLKKFVEHQTNSIQPNLNPHFLLKYEIQPPLRGELECQVLHLQVFDLLISEVQKNSI